MLLFSFRRRFTQEKKPVRQSGNFLLFYGMIFNAQNKSQNLTFLDIKLIH